MLPTPRARRIAPIGGSPPRRFARQRPKVGTEFRIGAARSPGGLVHRDWFLKALYLLGTSVKNENPTNTVRVLQINPARSVPNALPWDTPESRIGVFAVVNSDLLTDSALKIE